MRENPYKADIATFTSKRRCILAREEIKYEEDEYLMNYETFKNMMLNIQGSNDQLTIIGNFVFNFGDL